MCNKPKLEGNGPSNFDYNNQKILIQTEIIES